jgi:hypothetical protein
LVITMEYLGIILCDYIISVSIETPVLCWLLSPRYSMATRVFCGFFLTACSYPVMALVLPRIVNPFSNYFTFMTVAEVFAPVSECFVFWVLFARRAGPGKGSLKRDFVAIILANLASFAAGEVLKLFGLVPVIRTNIL